MVARWNDLCFAIDVPQIEAEKILAQMCPLWIATINLILGCLQKFGTTYLTIKINSCQIR